MTNWLVRKTGNNNNGGTSQTVRSTGSDGSQNNQVTTCCSSAGGSWSAADIGHGICFGSSNLHAVITAYAPAASFTVTTTSGSPNITSAGLFTAAMVGQAIICPGIVASNVVIKTFVDSSHVTLSANAGGGFGTGTATLTQTFTCDRSISTNGTNQTWTVGGAFLTIGSQLAAGSSVLAAGDNVYIGAGVYRENVTLGTSGAVGNPINVIGDVDGKFTGDAGMVRWTCFIGGDYIVSSGNAIASSAKVGWSFSKLYFEASSGNLISMLTTTDVTFTDCTFFMWSGSGSLISMTSLLGTVAANWLFDRCVMIHMGAAGTIWNATISDVSASVGDWDSNILIRNCFMFGFTSGILYTGAGQTGVRRSGGLRIVSTTIIGNATAAINVSNSSTVIPCEVRGCFIYASPNGVGLQAVTVGQIIESDNYIHASTVYSLVNPGANTQTSTPANAKFAPGFEFGQHFKITGRHRPWFSPRADSPLVAATPLEEQSGAGSLGALKARPGVPPGFPGWLAEPPPPPTGQSQPSVAIPKVDLLGRQRPAGGGRYRPAAGCYEVHDTARTDTVIYDVSPSSAKLIGPGDIELPCPVDASTVTISVRCYISASYAGPAPDVRIVANGELGVTAQTVTADAGAAGAWQTLTFAAITPTAAGFIRLRLNSYDAGTGQVNFDTIAAA